jgi:hypothetical protein
MPQQDSEQQAAAGGKEKGGDEEGTTEPAGDHTAAAPEAVDEEEEEHMGESDSTGLNAAQEAKAASEDPGYTSPMPSSADSAVPLARGPGQPYRTACALCVKRKRRCDGDGSVPCTLCRRKGRQCTYHTKEKRGPKPKVREAEDEVPGAAVGDPSASASPSPVLSSSESSKEKLLSSIKIWKQQQQQEQEGQSLADFLGNARQATGAFLPREGPSR